MRRKDDFYSAEGKVNLTQAESGLINDFFGVTCRLGGGGGLGVENSGNSK